MNPFIVLVIILGSHIPEIQTDRVNAVLNDKTLRDNNIILYLSGGVKYEVEQACNQPEAYQMINEISNYNLNNWKIFVNDKPNNTAYNFAYLRYDLEYNNKFKENIRQIIIVDSDWHKDRTEKIFYKIMNEYLEKNVYIDVDWILGKYKCSYCKSDESKHLKNVDSDINKALELYKFLVSLDSSKRLINSNDSNDSIYLFKFSNKYSYIISLIFLPIVFLVFLVFIISINNQVVTKDYNMECYNQV